MHSLERVGGLVSSAVRAAHRQGEARVAGTDDRIEAVVTEGDVDTGGAFDRLGRGANDTGL